MIFIYLKVIYLFLFTKHIHISGAATAQGQDDYASVVTVQLQGDMLQQCSLFFAKSDCWVISHTLCTNCWKKKDYILFYSASL